MFFSSCFAQEGNRLRGRPALKKSFLGRRLCQTDTGFVLVPPPSLFSQAGSREETSVVSQKDEEEERDFFFSLLPFPHSRKLPVTKRLLAAKTSGSNFILDVDKGGKGERKKGEGKLKRGRGDMEGTGDGRRTKRRRKKKKKKGSRRRRRSVRTPFVHMLCLPPSLPSEEPSKRQEDEEEQRQSPSPPPRPILKGLLVHL